MSLHLVKPPIMLDEDPGSLAAPQGTSPWARAMRVELRHMWEDGTTQLQRFLRYLSLMEREKGYQQLDDAFGHPFPSMRAFCIATPPHGAGIDPGLLDALAHETREMTVGQKVQEVQALKAHGSNQHTDPQIGGDIITSSKRGTSSRYRIARLKRDHPQIAADLADGKYPSVHAAAKAAGLVREPTPLEQLHRSWRKVSPDDRLRFLIEMLTPNERRVLSTGLFPEEP